MSNKDFVFGQILQIDLPIRLPPGREQEGMRPCLVIADPNQLQKITFSFLLIAPITGNLLEPGLMRIRLAVGAGGLPRESTILLDQISTVDANRVKRYYGTLNQEDKARIQCSLSLLLGEKQS